MRLFEAIVDANHRAVAGDEGAGIHPADFELELPVVALTCVDPRLNALFPNVLGLPGDQFVWLRNAGNIITGPLSSTMRSLALSCAVKGGKEIAIIGHSDCQVCKTSTMQLLEWLKNQGIERHLLPANINEYFGLFASEQQNVIKGCDIVRRSPLISPRIPVHGLIVEIDTGKLNWVVNGYQDQENVSSRWNEAVKSADRTVDALKSLTDFQIGEMKFPETKIGETVTKAEDWLAEGIDKLKMKPAEPGEPESKLESAARIAEQIVETAEKHWPKPSGQNPPSPPPILHPPPIRPRRRPGSGRKPG